MSGIGVGVGLGGARLSAEARKARSLPVPGAVVIAPFKSSAKNYGSSGGSFVASGGDPSFSGVCVLSAGRTLYKVVGAPAGDFTLVIRAKAAVAGCTIAAVGAGSPAAESSTGLSGSALGIGFFGLDRSFVGSDASAIAIDSNWHTFTVKKTGTTKALYIDGSVAVSTTAAANVTGTAISINGLYVSASHAFANSPGMTAGPAAYFVSSLSSGDQALVENWAATP